MHSKRYGRALLAAALTALVSAPAVASVVNGGFETGDFTGWTLGGDSSFSGVTTGIQHSGTAAAFFGPDPVGTLSQDVATVAGAGYFVSFWLALDDSATPSTFSWSLDGAVQQTLVNSAAFDYRQTRLFFIAGDSSTTLSFSFSNPASFWRLDDVSVEVPEPAAPLLAITALALLAATTRRQQS